MTGFSLPSAQRLLRSIATGAPAMALLGLAAGVLLFAISPFPAFSENTSSVRLRSGYAEEIEVSLQNLQQKSVICSSGPSRSSSTPLVPSQQ